MANTCVCVCIVHAHARVCMCMCMCMCISGNMHELHAAGSGSDIRHGEQVKDACGGDLKRVKRVVKLVVGVVNSDSDFTDKPKVCSHTPTRHNARRLSLQDTSTPNLTATVWNSLMSSTTPPLDNTSFPHRPSTVR